MLLTLAGKLLEHYEGTQKSDEEYLQRNSTCNRLRNAMLVRIGERSLIRRFKEAVIRMLIDDDEGMAMHLAQHLSNGFLLLLNRSTVARKAFWLSRLMQGGKVQG